MKFADQNYDTIKIEKTDLVLRVSLNRPEIKNAFNEVMIEEITDLFRRINKSPDKLRVIVLTGEGDSFCAGADLKWMKGMVDYSFEQNLEDSRQLSRMFHLLSGCRLPIVARVNGPALGGGTGLVAASDIAIACERAKFGFTEVKLGLAPAVISPYLVKKMGESNCRRYFLTGERFSANLAMKMGLVHEVVPENELDKATDDLVQNLISSGPQAMSLCKELLARGSSLREPDLSNYLTEVIARMRVSPEAQDGMNAFLEKRKPKWMS
jgi:methylglutaconyl-CoA hydratase